MYDAKDIVVIFSLVLMIVFLIAFAVWADHVKCEIQSESFGESDWGLIKGCMVDYNGETVPLENIVVNK
jgi:hypothetical protein